MRKMILSGVLLAAFVTPTFAQGQMPDQEGGQGGMAMGPQESNPGPGGPMRMMNGERMGVMMRIARELGSGVFYRVKRGNDEVDMHCPPGMPVQLCVGGLNQVMKTLQSTASGGGGTSGGESGQSSGGASSSQK